MGRGVQGMEGWVGDDCFHRFVPTFSWKSCCSFAVNRKVAVVCRLTGRGEQPRPGAPESAPAHNRHDTVKWLVIALLVLMRSVKTGH